MLGSVDVDMTGKDPLLFDATGVVANRLPVALEMHEPGYDANEMPKMELPAAQKKALVLADANITTPVTS